MMMMMHFSFSFTFFKKKGFYRKNKTKLKMTSVIF
jgi:hypothetical protein